MSHEKCIREVSPPTPATVLLIDLRNFTPNLNAAGVDEHGTNLFCYFLSNLYGLCLDTCLVVVPPHCRHQDSLSIASTGDGVLIIFLHESHVKHGYLAALLLNNVLQTVCDAYNANRKSAAPNTSFGIGIESGDVCRVRAYAPGDTWLMGIDTYIGSCINVAARLEGTTKLYHHATTIMGETTNELLCRSLFGVSYQSCVERAVDRGNLDDERLAAQDQLTALNRNLCVLFAHHHNLKGVDRPMPLYRVSNVSAVPGNPRFDALLKQLADDDPHLARILAFYQELWPARP
jgi:class 3 adenylate cyclase